jgi:signal transduction histidine kinase
MAIYASQLPDVPRHLVASWRRVTLVQQFMIVSSAMMLVAMAALGNWVSRTIEDGVANASTASAAVYMNSLLAPHLTAFAASGSLNPEVRSTLGEIAQLSLEQRGVLSLKIWGKDGLVLYSTHHEAEGKTFEPTEPLKRAWRGHLAYEYDELDDPESAYERQLQIPLLEIYAPLHNSAGRVVAVAEFYEDARNLDATLATARWRTWLVTGLTALAMAGALYWIVARGSRTIEEQRSSLRERVGELSELLNQNEELRSDLQASARRAAEENERLLNRLGSDLHDGAAQLISLALLRLKPSDILAGSEKARQSVQSVLRDALDDIRTVCSGLIMPEVRELSPREAFRYIVDVHQRRTGSQVDCEVAAVPSTLAQYAKICLCRFIQEGLNNAFRHAGGRGQKVRVWTVSNQVCVSVEDSGPGLEEVDLQGRPGQLGLVGMRHRIRNLGGTLEIRSVLGEGTYLEARLPLTGGELP